MGDLRFEEPYERLRSSAAPLNELRALTDEEVIAALAAASRDHEPYIANVLATEAENRTRRATAIAVTLADGLLAVDARSHVTLINPAAERMLGLDRSALVGRNIRSIPELEPENEILSECIEAGTVVAREEMVLQRSDGTRFDTDCLASPILRGQDVSGAVLLFRDTTERRRARQALAASEERFQLAVAGSKDGIWDWDLDADVVDYSDRWREIAGGGSMAPDLGAWTERIHPEDLDRFRSALRTHLAGITDVFENEHRIVLADGSVRWVLARGASVRRPDGRPYRIAGSLSDVTARRATADALRERDARYILLAENVSDAVLGLDEGASIAYASPSAERLLGRAARTLHGRSLYEFVHPNDVEALHEAAKRARASGRADLRHRVRSDGAYAAVETTLVAKSVTDRPSRVFVAVLRRTSSKAPPQAP